MLDISYCDKIEVTVKISGTTSEVITKAQSMAEEGVDLFNSSDSFFNDRCYPYTDSENNTDVPIQSRRDDYYQNKSLCTGDCEYNGIDYSTYTVKCKCDLANKTTVIEDKVSISPNELKNEFASSLTSSNFLVILCINLIIDFDIMKTNIGFYTLGGMLFLEIIIFIFSISTGTAPIWNFLKQFPKKSPPVKRNKSSVKFQLSLKKSKQDDIPEK